MAKAINCGKKIIEMQPRNLGTACPFDKGAGQDETTQQKNECEANPLLFL